MGGLVVISDSDPLNLQRRAAALENAGCRVTARALGAPLVSLLGEGGFPAANVDVVILGADAGVLDAKVCEAVRARIDAPVLVVSPKRTAPLSAVESLLQAGADDVMLAPAPSALNRRIAMWRKAEMRNALDDRRAAALSNAAALQASDVLDARALDAIASIEIPEGDDPLAAMLAETAALPPTPKPAPSPGRKPTPAAAKPAPVAAKAPPKPAAPAQRDTRRDWNGAGAPRPVSAEPARPRQRPQPSPIERLKAQKKKDEQTERVWR